MDRSPKEEREKPIRDQRKTRGSSHHLHLHLAPLPLPMTSPSQYLSTLLSCHHLNPSNAWRPHHPSQSTWPRKMTSSSMTCSSPPHFPTHPHISPCPSDISIENLSLPLENFCSHNNTETRERTKFKSFSSFFGLGKWRKASDIGEKEETKTKKKKGFDVSRFLKKYARMVDPFLFFKRDSRKGDLRRRPYSFSGRPNPKEKVGWRGRRGEFSAPASMRTSPTNSGLLTATSLTFNSSDESTMEELQNAIQAAIAHCKNSTAMKEEKCK